MKSHLAAAVWACAAVLGACTVVSGAELKVAIIDMEQVVKAFPDTETAETLLKQQLDEFEAERDEMLEKTEGLKKDFEKAREEAMDKALSESERVKKEDVAKDKLMAIRDHEQKLRETIQSRQKQLNEQESRMRKRIIGKLKDIITEHAQKKGFTLVLDSAGQAISGVETVLYAADSVDITADILKIIEQKKGEKKDELPAADAARDSKKTEK